VATTGGGAVRGIGGSVSGSTNIPLPGAVTASSYQSTIASVFGVPATKAALVAAEYPLSAFANPALAFSALDSDANFACPALQIDRWTSRYVPTFAYQFSDQNAPPLYVPPTPEFPLIATHGSELRYLFNLPTAPSRGRSTRTRWPWRPPCDATGPGSPPSACRSQRAMCRDGRSVPTAMQCSPWCHLDRSSRRISPSSTTTTFGPNTSSRACGIKFSRPELMFSCSCLDDRR
jgi:hypothetical protein